MRCIFLVGCIGALLSGCATTYEITPLAIGTTTTRYEQGVPLTASNMPSGSVQVKPLGVNNQGRLMFGVAAVNQSPAPANFGIENISLFSDIGLPIRLFTHDELERQAKNAATWAAVAVAVAGADSAYAASQNAYSTTTGSIYGRHGTTNFVSQTYDPTAAALGVGAASAATAAGLIAINRSLDDTIANLNGRILRTTTIDPGQIYGGQVVSDHIKLDKPKIVVIHVGFNNDDHEFRYTVKAVH
jgi:hypothetical protein